jgi:polysaccharide biosynthesis transport protein
MGFQSYLTPLLKWWWLILLSTVLAFATSLFAVWNLPLVYTSHTTLIIGKTISNPNPSTNDFWLNQQLASFYTDLSYRDPVVSAVKKAVGMNVLPGYTVKPLGNNQFLEIDVTDANPQLAAKVASELARQIIAISPGGLQSSDPARSKFADDQLTKTQAQIVDTESQITKKQNDLGTIQSASDLETAKTEIKTLEDKLILLQTNYSNLLASSKPAMTNILEVIEPANIPTQPSGLSKFLIIAIACAAGFGLGIGASYLLEGVDRSFKNPKEIEKELGLPILGYLMDMGKQYQYTRYVADHPRSMLAEAFRSLRANLEILGANGKLKTVMVTSPDQGDGKTSVSVNLAINLAQGGKQVILLDADIRRPTVHKYFSFQDRIGVMDVLEGRVDIASTLKKWGDGKLSVMAAGQGEKINEDSFSAEKVAALLHELKGMSDIVVIDNPPIAVADTLIFASKVDGILFVVCPGTTNRDMARLMKERIEAAKGNIIGVVLNRIPLSKSGFYGEYRHYIPYYYANEEGKAPERERTFDKARGKKKTMVGQVDQKVKTDLLTKI